MKPHNDPQPCRVCGEPVLWRSGLSNRIHSACRTRKQAKPERLPTPAYKLARAAKAGAAKPNADIGKGNHRDRNLLDLAHELHDCTNCGRHVAEGLEPAHANAGMTRSKGLGIKANDGEHAALCNACHSWLDQPISAASFFDPSKRFDCTRTDKREMWLAAYFRTQAEYWKRGWLHVAA